MAKLKFLLEDGETVLQESRAAVDHRRGERIITLTSQRIAVECEKGVFKKKRKTLKLIPLSDIRLQGGFVQIKQKKEELTLCLVSGTVTFTFERMTEAAQFKARAVTAITGTTVAEQVARTAEGVLNLVDGVLGVDSRGALKDALHGSLFGKRK